MKGMRGMKRSYMISPAAMGQRHVKRARNGRRLILIVAPPEMISVGCTNSLTVAR